MDFLEVALKSFFSIVAIFFFTKVMGRKQLSQLSLYDYVVGITIGSVAAEMATDLEGVFFHGLLALSVYTIVSVLISFVTIKSIKLRRFLTGTSNLLIENGKIIEGGLKKAKYDINDLLQEARSNGYFDISEIEYALMEASGRISFLPKSKYVPLTPNDAKVKVDYKGLCTNVIIDGNIMKNNLKTIKKDEKWLKTRLKKEGHENPRDLLLVTCDSKEKLSIYKKDERAREEGCFE